MYTITYYTYLLPISPIYVHCLQNTHGSINFQLHLDDFQHVRMREIVVLVRPVQNTILLHTRSKVTATLRVDCSNTRLMMLSAAAMQVTDYCCLKKEKL